MSQIMTGGVLGGVVWFLWGAVSWMVLPWHNATLPWLPESEAIVGAIAPRVPETGVYLFPAADLDENGHPKVFEEEYLRRHREGPIGMLIWRREGVDPLSGAVFAKGIALNFAQAFLAAFLCWAAAGRLPTYGCRVTFVALLGVFAALSTHVAGLVWFHFPAAHFLVMAADVTVGSLLAGLAIAWRIRPPAGASCGAGS